MALWPFDACTTVLLSLSTLFVRSNLGFDFATTASIRGSLVVFGRGCSELFVEGVARLRHCYPCCCYYCDYAGVVENFVGVF